MKKIFILLAMLIVLMSCKNDDSNIITEQNFIDNLNSFDSSATYFSVEREGIMVANNFVFIVKSNDSLFIYRVENTAAIKSIFRRFSTGDKVKPAKFEDIKY